MIDDIEAAIASYPYAGEYRSWPGPNSNTFLAHIGREVPALKLDLPANAIGKDYRELPRVVGVSPTGSGLQLTLLGVLGVSVGLQEGIEFNLLGLNFGVDLNRPALRLPFVGRLGMDDVAARALTHVSDARRRAFASCEHCGVPQDVGEHAGRGDAPSPRLSSRLARQGWWRKV